MLNSHLFENFLTAAIFALYLIGWRWFAYFASVLRSRLGEPQEEKFLTCQKDASRLCKLAQRQNLLHHQLQQNKFCNIGPRLAYLTDQAERAQKQYEMEVMKSGDMMKVVQELRGKISNFGREKSAVESENRHSKESVESLRKNLKEMEEKLISLKSQHAVVEDENRALHEQVIIVLMSVAYFVVV